MSNAVCWFEIYVADMARAQAFYETVLDVELAPIGNPETADLAMMAFPFDENTGGSSGAIVSYEGCKTGGNSTIVYFACDDCSVEESRVEAAGGKLERSKMSIGEYGFVSLAFDPDGNQIGLYSQK